VALIARLEADANLGAAATPVQIAVGHPYPEVVEREVLVLRNTAPGDTLAAARGYSGEADIFLGDRKREESYVTELVVSVSSNIRNDQQTLETRAYELAEFVATSLRNWVADPAWTGISVPSGAQFLWCRLNARELTQTLDKDAMARGANIALAIACRARL
jgi:hypothetical protein